MTGPDYLQIYLFLNEEDDQNNYNNKENQNDKATTQWKK